MAVNYHDGFYNIDPWGSFLKMLSNLIPSLSKLERLSLAFSSALANNFR
jgi:hypothetical protein